MKKIIMVVLCLSTLLIVGCVVPVAKSTPLAGGLIYSNMRFSKSVPGVEDAQPGPKRGSASMSGVLWAVTTGNSSISQAARNAGISKIKTVEYEYMNVLLVYQRYTTYVTGE